MVTCGRSNLHVGVQWTMWVRGFRCEDYCKKEKPDAEHPDMGLFLHSYREARLIVISTHDGLVMA